jgi:hypothetical protein
LSIKTTLNRPPDVGAIRMPLTWKDNKPGWQQRLEASLDAIGLREAERRLATDFYDREYRETVESWIKRAKIGPLDERAPDGFARQADILE